MGGSVAEWSACWTQTQKGPGSIAVATLSGNSLMHCSHPSCLYSPSCHMVAALLRVTGVTAGLAESNGSLPPGLWLTLPAGWLPRTGISSRTLCSVIEYGLPLPFTFCKSLFSGCGVGVSSCCVAWWNQVGLTTSCKFAVVLSCQRQSNAGSLPSRGACRHHSNHLRSSCHRGNSRHHGNCC